MRKWILVWLFMGIVYYAIEGLWRLITGDGYAHGSMIFVGGLCGLCVGGINQIPRFYDAAIWKQSLIGSIITLTIEFISGVILNIWMGLGIWDYSQMPFNFMGQICLLFGIAWFFLMPFAIWLEDWLRYKLYGELWPGCKDGKMYSWSSVYKDLFTFKKY